MPFAGPPGQPPTLLESLVPLLHASFHPLGAAVAEAVTLPGQALISLVLVLAAAWRLWTSGRGESALAWPAAWVLATGVELVFRHTLSRPPLYRDGVHVPGFDSSWPSGHALRCAIVAAALAVAWPRLLFPLVAWLGAAVALLVLAGFHTPTDVAGGLLLATVVLAGVAVLSRSGFLRGRAGLRGPRPRA